jgi:hypothetical protein
VLLEISTRNEANTRVQKAGHDTKNPADSQARHDLVSWRKAPPVAVGYRRRNIHLAIISAKIRELRIKLANSYLLPVYFLSTSDSLVQEMAMSPRTLMVRLNCYLAESSVVTINEIIHPFGNRINAFLELDCLKRTALNGF